MMEQMDMEKIGERIRYARRERDMTQGELAEKIGVSVSFIGHVERGTRAASTETLVAISDALDTSLDVILKGSTVDRQAYGTSLSKQYMIQDMIRLLADKEYLKEQKDGQSEE